MRSAACVLLLVALAAAATPVAADPAADKQRALELFKESNTAYKAGELEKAADLLRQAYALYPEPILLYNLARTLEGMGSTQEAIEQYEKYLAEAPDVRDRGAIERRIATMREQLAARDEERRQRIAAERDAELHKQATVEVSAAPASKLPFVVIGAGLVATGVGAGFGYLSHSRRDQAASEPVEATAQDLLDRAHTYATTANVLFIAGGSLVVAGAIWAVIDRQGRHRAAASTAARVGLGPSYVGVTWVWP
jgi:tetratricopeptide (TPR) repeat protein